MIPELIGWLVAFIALSVIEAVSVQLISIWFACGSVGAFIAALCGAPLWLQFVIFAAVSVILLAATRPLAKKLLKSKPVPTNADSVIGKTGVVLQDIDNLTDTGRIHADGLDWNARSEDGSPLQAGETVTIRKIEGATAYVVKAVAK